MATKLYAVSGSYRTTAMLTSTESKADAEPLPPGTVTHTGGSDDDFIKIPNMSSFQYFDGHHITIGAADGSWQIAVWNNDKEDHLLFWSLGPKYSTINQLGFRGDGGVALFIDVDQNNVVQSVAASQW